jgi:hypothetical protein
MGLDMYLNKRHYFWKHKGVGVTAIDSTHKSIQPARIKVIDEEIMYWRKANHIHKWFVDISEREDDCRDIEVSREQLIELRDRLQQVLADHSIAEELLPVQDGFFFGSTDYDKYYFNDCKETLDMLQRELSVEVLVGEDVDYVYRASW